MPTTRTRFVNLDSSGGDGTTNNTSGATAAYASLSAALAGEAGDVTASDEIVEVLVDGSGTTNVDTTAYNDNGDGWVTDATRYVIVKPNTGNSHSGVWDTSIYQLEGNPATGQGMLTFRDGLQNVRIEGLQVGVDSPDDFNPRRIIHLQHGSGSSADVRIDKCLLRLVGTGDGDRKGIDSDFTAASSTDVVRVSNTIIYVDSTHTGVPGTSIGFDSVSGGGETIHCYNVTVHGWGDFGFRDQLVGGSFRIKNCLADGNGTDFSGTFTAAEHNASSDATAPGTNSRTSQTFTFQGTDDFRLTSGDSGAKEHGTDLSADPDLAFSDDVAGTTRPIDTSWDIGAHEAATSGGGGSTPAGTYYHRFLGAA